MTIATNKLIPHYSVGPAQSGFSLVELMVAVALGLVLVAGVALLSLNSSQIHRAVTGAGQQIENGRFAMDRLREDLHHAGFFGRISPSGASWALPAVLPDPCDTSSGTTGTILSSLANSLVLPVTGYNNQSSSPISCIDNTDIVPATDILVIRRVDTSTTALNSLSSDDTTYGNVYIQTGNTAAGDVGYVIGYCTASSTTTTSSSTPCTGLSGLNDGSAPAAVTGSAAAVFNLTQLDGSPSEIRRYHVHIYYVRPWSANSSENPRIPTLVREVLTNRNNVPVTVTEALIDGIENMQIQYGLDDGTAPGVANDGAPDRYAGAPADVTAWANVVTVRVNLLVRNMEADSSYTDNKIYHLGDGDITSGGHYKRHVFSNLVKLTNVGTRRE